MAGTSISIHAPITRSRSLRCLGERRFALLTGCWRTLHHVTSPCKVGAIVRAALVLSHFEHGYIT
jgi:hypothetical protein